MGAAELLQHIDPARLAYQDWLAVGMALKHEGATAAEWDAWSRSDQRYKAGDCFRRWEGFNGSATPVTGGTLYELARRRLRCERGRIWPRRSAGVGISNV